jgi:hypothetical protein
VVILKKPAVSCVPQPRAVIWIIADACDNYVHVLIYPIEHGRPSSPLHYQVLMWRFQGSPDVDRVSMELYMQS